MDSNAKNCLTFRRIIVQWGKIGKVMTDKPTATWIKNIETHGWTHASLYKLSVRLNGYKYVIVSASDRPELGILETYIFGADETGVALSMGELNGSTQGILSHKIALNNAGYDVEKDMPIVSLDEFEKEL